MVAPVVLITQATLFGNGLMAYGLNLADKVFALNRERAGIPRGLTARFASIHSAILIIWIPMGMLVLSVAAIAVAVTARSGGFAFAALGLVTAGVVGVFIGVALVIIPAAEWADVVAEETRRTGMLD